MDEAVTLYHAGKFVEAERAYRKALNADPTNVEALAGAGAVALLGNRVQQAQRCLEQAVERSPDHRWALQNLAEAAYRQDDFVAAARWLRRAAHAGAVDRTDSEVIARKLEAFRGVTPYRIDGDRRDVTVPLEIVDPLPVVNVGLGDGRIVPFFIDTGGHEVYLDQALVRDLRLATFGSTRGAGAGGKQATEGHAHLDAMTLGGLRIHDIPVKTLDFSALGFAEALGGVDVKGVIGTAFLYHFLSTIDYPGGALILRPPTPQHRAALGRHAANRHVVPFWLSGTHFLLAWGTVNDSDPMLLVVDTGGAGIGFVATRSTIDPAGITLDHDQAIAGPGAGGTAQAIPFVVDKLSIGDVSVPDVNGVFFPETDLEKDLGRDFPIGGILSHQFFRPHALTLDFVEMRLILTAPSRGVSDSRRR